MDYIEVLVGVISALISSIVLIWWGMRICKKDITIKHNVDPYSWFMIHTIVYFITILDLFEGEYTFEKYTEEDIRKNIEMDLSKFATDRKDILKEGWSKVYEVCEQKEKEK